MLCMLCIGHSDYSLNNVFANRKMEANTGIKVFVLEDSLMEIIYSFQSTGLVLNALDIFTHI